MHHNDIQSDGYKSLNEEQEVEFEVEASPKGPRAINIKVIEQA